MPASKTTNQLGPDHYRYYATLDPGGVTVSCERFVVIGETECCYYVISSAFAHLADIDWSTASHYRKKLRKRVLKSSYRRYCYPDKAQALASFRSRQKWRIAHASRNLAIAQLSLSVVEPVLEQKIEPEEKYKAGQNEYTRSLSWEDC
jgi:hypothetical protein